MYGALLLFESEFVHVVAISFTALVLTELLMVALTVRTWHWVMVLAELFSLLCYAASLAFLNEYFGMTAPPARATFPLSLSLFLSFLSLSWFPSRFPLPLLSP